MSKSKKNLKYLLFGAMAIAVTSCADDAVKGGIDSGADLSEASLKSASMTVGQMSMSYVSNVDTWSRPSTRATSEWEDELNFSIPSDLEDLTGTDVNLNAQNFVIPASINGEVSLGWKNLNGGISIYVLGNVTNLKEFNVNGNDPIKIFVATDASLSFGPTTGKFDIYNAGDLTLKSFANVTNIYNKGEVTFDEGNEYWTPDSNDIPNSMSIYSREGIINFAKDTRLKAFCEINGMAYVNGEMYIENNTEKDICGLEVTGRCYITDDNFSTSYLKAETIELNGHPVKLLPEALVVATSKLIIPNSNSIFNGYDGSYALIKTKDIEFRDNRNFDNCFSANIYFDISGTIYTANDGPMSVEEYVAKFGGGEKFNSEISGSPACGPNFGTTPPEKEDTPFLELVAEVESHDHNSDKATGRKLSATAVDWDGNTIYVSYHMRGGNYANDFYDNDDDVEGCIETWQFNTNEQNQTIIELGKYMWTKEFDFNHILIDGSDIITMGHKDNNGAIIGRLNNVFTSFIPSFEENGPTTSAELTYKYLTTDEPLYGDYFNPNQGTSTNQKVDYENAGDGNCVIKVGDKYFVATYAGYGMVNADDFSRVKDENDNVAFVSTPGSVKHIINKGNDEIALLYLTERPTVTAEAKSGAEVVVIGKDAYPFGGQTLLLDGFVQPVDGKNVLAWDETTRNMFACLGKGGLNVNGQIYKFGQDNEEPVNGVAFDSEYVYVAGGSHIRVLDRNTMEEVTHYANPNMSSNYIKVIEYSGDKYILVAYGQSGVKVFRLNTGK